MKKCLSPQKQLKFQPYLLLKQKPPASNLASVINLRIGCQTPALRLCRPRKVISGSRPQRTVLLPEFILFGGRRPESRPSRADVKTRSSKVLSRATSRVATSRPARARRFQGKTVLEALGLEGGEGLFESHCWLDRAPFAQTYMRAQ